MAIHERQNNQNNANGQNPNVAPKEELKEASSPEAGIQLQQPATGFERAQRNDQQSNNREFVGNEKFDWLDMGALNPYHVNTSSSAVALTQAVSAVKEFWDENLSPDLHLEMIPVDKSTRHDLLVSLLIFTVRDKRSETGPIAYYTILVEGSIDPIPPRIDNINGRQVEIMRLTSDAYDDNMRIIADQAVRRRFPKASTLLVADATVMPRNFDLTSETNIRNLTINSVLACNTQLALANPNYTDINLANARRDSANLQQSVTYSRLMVENDLMGVPVRNDITLTTTAVPLNNPNIMNMSSEIITRVSGYIDLLYLDNTSQTNDPMSMWRAQMNTGSLLYRPTYVANLVLTSIMNSKVQTLPGILLGLVNASFIRENESWLTYFLPSVGSREKDAMHDIGNIGYDVAIAKPDTFEKIKTTPDAFGIAELMKIYNNFFHPGLAIAIDIPDCGATTWQYATIAAAAGGSQRSMQHIRTAADILTNGAFSRYYNGDGNFFFRGDNTIMLGYYEAKDGRRDIRDLDYLAVAGLAGKKDRAEIATYTDTLTGPVDLPTRLEMRRTMTETYLRNVTYTGYATRAFAEEKFIEALINGVKECGYFVQPQQTPYLNDLNYQRANAGYVQGAILDNRSSGIFRQPLSSYQGGNFGGRWGNGY